MKAIHAIYENGVFRPTDPVELPENCRVALTVSPEQQPAQSEPSSDPPLIGLMEALDQLPAKSELPEDFAAQHDHYLYGTPKRP